jgi:hypothetical protein
VANEESGGQNRMEIRHRSYRMFRVRGMAGYAKNSLLMVSDAELSKVTSRRLTLAMYTRRGCAGGLVNRDSASYDFRKSARRNTKNALM